MTSATRRAVVAAAGATALTSVTGMEVNAAGEKPNIIFILADDLGYADLSCFGQTDYQTPVLDRLAKDGLRLTDCYANSAVCSATRTALATGRYQFRLPIGLREPAGGDVFIPPEHPTIASLLRSLGYRTSLLGKWHLGNYPDHGPRQSGYDYCIGFNGGASDYFNHTLWENDVQVEKSGYLTDILTEKAIAELRTAKASGKPFFMSLHYNAPHWPWEGPGDREVANALVPAGGRGGAAGGAGPGAGGPGRGGRGPGGPGAVGAAGAAAPGVAGPAGAGRGPGGAGRGPGGPGGGGGAAGGSGGLRHNDGGSLKKYGEMVGYMDAAIGKVLAALRAQGQEKNTIVVFTSDNGGERFSKVWPFTGMKGELLEGGIRVPGIVRWPAGIAAGRTSGQMTTSMDWLPTLVGAAGGAPDRAYPTDGENLLPVLTGKAPVHSRKLFWRYKAEEQAAVRDGNMKYLKIGSKEYLFDVAADPDERANIRGKNTPLFDRLKQDYAAWNKGMLPYPENMGSENAKSVGNIPDRY